MQNKIETIEKTLNDTVEYIFIDGSIGKVEDGVLYRFKMNENGNFKVASTFEYKNIRDLIPEEHMNSLENSKNKSIKPAKKEFKFEFSVDRNGNKFISGYKFKNKNETKNYIFDENGNAREIFTEKTQFHEDGKTKKSYNRVEQFADGSSENMESQWNAKFCCTIENRYGVTYDGKKFHHNISNEYYKDSEDKKTFSLESLGIKSIVESVYREFNRLGETTLDENLIKFPNGVKSYNNTTTEYFNDGKTQKWRNYEEKKPSGYIEIKKYKARNGKSETVTSLSKNCEGEIEKDSFISRRIIDKNGNTIEVVQNFVENDEYVTRYLVNDAISEDLHAKKNRAQDKVQQQIFHP